MQYQNNGKNVNLKDKLSICILFYEKADQTIECVKSFLNTEVPIYILDNGSSTSSRKILDSYCKNYKSITIMDSDINLGVANGRNYLIDHTKEAWMLFVDNDITINTNNWLYIINEYMQKYHDFEVFIPKLFDVSENKYCVYNSFKINKNKIITYNTLYNKYRNISNYFPGGASFINRRLFDHLGLYDKNMFTGWEDFELAIRAIITGEPIKCMLVKDIELIHNHKQVLSKEDSNAVKTRYNIDLLQKSHDRIFEKYGIIIDDNNWQFWAKDQINKMVKNI